jgi:hypothetical protein
MPLTLPTLDDRNYQQLVDEALARIPVHTPEWTNFNKSDPGVTLIELFAFLTETLLYRSNQIPERNRRKFLQLLGVPLQPASAARGVVTFANERGPQETLTLDAGLEVLAGQVPFRTVRGLDVLPLEARVFYKRALSQPTEGLKAYYDQLYASFLRGPVPTEARLYETVPFPPRDGSAVDVAQQSVDGSLWIALMLRAGDRPAQPTPAAWMDLRTQVRGKIGGKTVNLGVVPSLGESGRTLLPAGRSDAEGTAVLKVEIPIGGLLPSEPSQRRARYRALDVAADTDVLAEPGVVQVTLPPAADLALWDNLDPLESGVGDFPPALDDTNLNERVLTWLRVGPRARGRAAFLWVGINASMVEQRAHIGNELLPKGSGAPDQTVRLSKTPVIPDSVRLTVANGTAERWTRIDDLTAAGPEVPVADPRQPPGARVTKNDRVKVFAVDAESGEVRFGDGLRGARPPLGATVRVDYDYSVGRDGNVNPEAITSGPALPAGVTVTNPVRTWGGAEAETVAEGEKHIARYLQHRDRLVNAADFETITRRTPGVDIGRVDVIPAFTPELDLNEPGDAPGAVTLMIVPKYDPAQPDAPYPDQLFLDAVCDYIDGRRLVTTEVFLRGPTYMPIWISIGINTIAGQSIAEVREAVKRRLAQFFAPLPARDANAPEDETAVPTLQIGDPRRGWPLRKPVVALELMAEASRVAGVSLVNQVLLASGSDDPAPQVEMRGLELPRVAGISVSIGDPIDLAELRGTPSDVAPTAELLPVPVIPQECQ